MGEIVEVVCCQLGREIRPRLEALGIFEAPRIMREPVGRFAVGQPIARRALHTFERCKLGEVFTQPAIEQRPLPKQRLMGGLDRLLATGRAIRCQEPLRDQMLHQRAGLLRYVAHPRDRASRRSRVGIDAGEPGNEGASQQSQPREAVPRHGGVGIGRLQRLLNSGLDRAGDAADVAIFIEPEIAIAAMLEIEPFEREREKRQRILGPALLDILKQRGRELGIDLERPLRILETQRRTFDDRLIGAPGHRRQVHGLLVDVLQQGFGLQRSIGIRADGDEDDEIRIIGREQVLQQRAEGL